MRKIFFGILSLVLVFNCSPEQKVKSRLYIFGINNCKVIFCSIVNILNIFQRGYIFLSNFNKSAFRIYKIIQNEIHLFDNTYVSGNRIRKILFNLTGENHRFTNNFFHIFDLLGREARILVDEYKQAGRYQIRFDASELSSGIYFYKMRAGGYTGTKKLILTK